MTLSQTQNVDILFTQVSILTTKNVKTPALQTPWAGNPQTTWLQSVQFGVPLTKTSRQWHRLVFRNRQ